MMRWEMSEEGEREENIREEITSTRQLSYKKVLKAPPREKC